jgi:hypothetical protein
VVFVGIDRRPDRVLDFVADRSHRTRPIQNAICIFRYFPPHRGPSFVDLAHYFGVMSVAPTSH